MYTLNHYFKDMNDEILVSTITCVGIYQKSITFSLYIAERSARTCIICVVFQFMNV